MRVNLGRQRRSAQIKGMALCMVDNLGPGGTAVTALALIVLLYRRPGHWLLLCLPFISVVAFGLAPVGYTQTRFFTIAALSLVPPVAVGLSVLLDAAGRLGAGWRLLLIRVPIGAAVVANLIAGSFAWICPGGLQAKAMEQVALTLPKCSQIFVLSGEFNFPHHKGASRLEWLGYDVDLRTVQDLMAHPESRPEWLFANQGMVHFIDDCATLPARAKMLKAESGFDFGRWRGWRRWVQAVSERSPVLPRWFIFEWLPDVRHWESENQTVIYRRNDFEPCIPIHRSWNEKSFTGGVAPASPILRQIRLNKSHKAQIVELLFDPLGAWFFQRGGYFCQEQFGENGAGARELLAERLRRHFPAA